MCFLIIWTYLALFLPSNDDLLESRGITWALKGDIGDIDKNLEVSSFWTKKVCRTRPPLATG